VNWNWNWNRCSLGHALFLYQSGKTVALVSVFYNSLRTVRLS
jgi:hypothetical protein